MSQSVYEVRGRVTIVMKTINDQSGRGNYIINLTLSKTALEISSASALFLTAKSSHSEMMGKVGFDSLIGDLEIKEFVESGRYENL